MYIITLKPKIHKHTSMQHRRNIIYSHKNHTEKNVSVVIQKTEEDRCQEWYWSENGKWGIRVKTDRHTDRERGAMKGSSTWRGCQDSRRSGKGTEENGGRWEEDQRPGWQDKEWRCQLNLGFMKMASYPIYRWWGTVSTFVSSAVILCYRRKNDCS